MKNTLLSLWKGLKNYQSRKEIVVSTVDHPEHYNKGSIEAINIIEDWDLNFSVGNVIKYMLRAPHKGDEINDLEKAKWYLERHIENVKNGGTK